MEDEGPGERRVIIMRHRDDGDADYEEGPPPPPRN